MDYYPYGKILRSYNGSATEKFLFTGKERDIETEFDYLGARFLDTDIGRFLQTDPHTENYTEWTPYNYVGGNPVLRTDPDGKDWFVNKSNGNVVFAKGQNEIPKEYGQNKDWENLGKDNMFDKLGHTYSKTNSSMYMNSKTAKSFMKEQGYEAGTRLAIERTTYDDKSGELGPGNNINSKRIEEKILSRNATYVPYEKLDEETVVSSEKNTVLIGITYKTVDKISVVRKGGEGQSSSNNDAYMNGVKYGAEKLGEGLLKILSKKR